MKQKYLFLLMSLLLLLCGAQTSQATITTGYYRVVSYNGKYLTENTSSHSLICSDLMEGNYSQVWYLSVDGTNVTFKNALTDYVIIPSFEDNSIIAVSPSEWSAQKFTVAEETGSVYTFTYGYDKQSNAWGLHCDGSNNVVKWYITEAKSKWTLESVTVDDAALTAQKNATSEASTSDLLKVFTSTACTELKSGYSAADLDALPATAQTLVDKINGNSWATYNDWDKTEKSFRIADYKAYSSHTRWTSILGLSYSLGRLANPTGIYVEAGDYIQVYVGEIPAGETVKLEVAGVGQSSGSLYSLHEGMNSLLMAASGNCFVQYEVDNTTNGGTPYKALSEYADVTVHIEGGTVQGYFDLTKNNTNADWAVMTANANLLTKPAVCLKSKTHVFNLHRDRLLNGLGDGGEVVEMMTVWQNVAELEDNLMARGDFDDYCNCTFSVTTLDGTGNPHANNYGTFYHEGSDGLFNAVQLLQNFGGLWTIAHEQGHNHQNLIKMAGTTEISNNMFSNAVIDWQGRFVSRVNSIQNTYNRWRQGQSWPERIGTSTDARTWDCLSLYVQLYQYFHQAGNNTNFYPDLFRALRSDPMVINGTGAFTLASNDYLKFYKKCCDVAQLDLTEFFEVYGFFLLPPTQESKTLGDVTSTTYRLIEDYSNSYLHVTQEMINEAKAYVAAKNYPKCNLIFIEDRVTAPLATYEGHAEGERRTIFDTDRVSAFGLVGETGQYDTFNATCSDYIYNVDESSVTMEGTGAVGFKVYDSTGALRGVYNTYTFTLPDGIGTGYTIKAAAGNGTDVVATLDASETWYYIQMQNGKAVLTSQGEGEFLMTAEAQKSLADAQLWKKVATDANHFKFVTRGGQTMYYDTSASRFKTTATPTVGYAFQVVATTNSTYSGSYEIYVDDLDSSQAYLNQWGGSGAGKQLGCWNKGDGNNPLQFVPENEMIINDVKPSAVEEVTLAGTTSWTPTNKHTLWYTQPATVWMTSTLPIGNGQFGGCIMGGVKREEVQFNDKTLWKGHLGNPVDNGSFGCYLNFGNLYITSTDETITEATNYRRWLDIDEARAGVAYTANDVDYEREYICSNPDKVIAIRYTASENGKINENLTLFNQNGAAPTYTVADGIGVAVFSGTVERTGTTNDESYYCQMKVVATGGTITATADGINVSGANEMVIYLFGATNFSPDNDDYLYNASLLPANVQTPVAAAVTKGYNSILADHVADYKALYDRCALNITSAANTVSTPQLISNFASDNANNLLLEEMYFSYGRYLMISSSRGVDLPNNLQGIWNDNNSPAWHSDIHANINVQMNYWPAEVTNLSELHMPFLNYIKREACDRPQWQKNATTYAGQTTGWTLTTENNIYGSGSNWMQNYTIANAWYCMHLWQHYRYTLDTDYLRDVALPAMRSCCEYWMERLVLASDGTYECPNEYSPEHGPGSENATAHSQQLVWDLFNNTLQAYDVLNITNDATFLADLQNKFANLDKGTATEVVNGQTLLREWKYTSQNDVSSYSNHRHLSHLMGLYPGTQIADDADPAIYQAAINSLNARGYEGTGWSMGWKINCHARAKDGDRCQSLIATALHITTNTGNSQGGGIYENLWDAHTPYQIDGNFGATAGMAEMLLQSHQNKLELLPALPAMWSEGSVTGLRAVDNFTVDLAWSEGKATNVSVTSNAGKTAVVKYPNAAYGFDVTCEGQKVAFTKVNINEISFPTVAGKTYLLVANGKTNPVVTGLVGSQVTSEGDIVSGKPYVLQSMATGTPYVTENNGKYSLPNAGNSASGASVYYLISNGDGTWKIKNFETGNCWGVPTYNTALAAVEESAAGSWSLNFSGGIAYPTAPDADNTERGLDRSSQQMVGYSTGTGATKQIKIFELAQDDISWPVGTSASVVNVGVQVTSANEVASGEYYVIYQPRNHSYGNEDSDNKLRLYGDNASPDETTNTDFVFKLISNGDGTYQIQTHSGRYFPVPTKNGVISSSETAGSYTLNFDANGNIFPRCTNGNTTYGMDRGSNQFYANSSYNSTVGGAQCYQLFHANLSCPKIVSATAVGGHQTTGLGNSNAILERIQVSTVPSTLSVTKLTATLKNNTSNSISSVKVYSTTKNQLYADGANPVLLGETTSLGGNTVKVNLSGTVSNNSYLWLVADIKSDEALIGSTIDACVTEIEYAYSGEPNLFSLTADPSGEMKIFKTQQMVFTPSHSDTEYYRIPAMMIAKDGGIVAITDARHISTEDIGKSPAHTIDVVARRSTDAGKTWGDVIDVAIVDAATQGSNFGYGDAAIVRADNGDLICLMAGGTSSFQSGMTELYLTKSTDNGLTWSEPVNIYPDIEKNGLNVTSIFTTSGRGLTTADGTLMFATLCKVNGASNNYVLKSTDNGATWSLCANPAYTGADEAKLIQRLDGSLLISTRTAGYASGGNRGFNTGSSNGETWGTQYQASTLWGNGSNHDIIYYGGVTDRTPNGVLLHTMCNSNGREKLTLYMSLDGGATWNNVYQIQAGLSAYSCMQKLSNGDVAFLFEDGTIRDKGDEYAINYLVLTKEQLDEIAEPLIEAYATTLQNAANDLTYHQAMNTIVNGGQYYIYTEYEDTRYYLSASGWSQTDKSNAGQFTFNKSSNGTYKPEGWELVNGNSTHFTNADNAVDGHIHTGSQNRNTWERQVFFLNALTGKYAVRSTNAADGSGYKCSAFWYLHEYNDGNGAFMATDYDLENIGTAHFVWELEPVNEETLNYQRSLNKLEDGGVYTIATKYVNDVETETTRYLKADGTLTTDASRAKFFTFQKRTISGGYVASGWKSAQFTNPASASTPGTRIRTDSQNRDTWDTQAYFLNADGLFAVRATNAATESTWGSNTYWSTDADGNACCMNDGAHYIWEVVKVGETPAISSNTTYTFTASNGRTLKNGNSGGYLTVGTSGAGEYYITPASETGRFYLRDLTNETYVTKPTSNSDGNGWQVGSEAQPCIIQYITKDNLNKYMITGVYNTTYSVASAHYTGSANVNNYSDVSDELSYWTMEATQNNTANFVAESNKPNRTYYIKNESTGNYFASATNAESQLLTTSSADDAATYVFIPVSGQSGQYYLYDAKTGLYAVPDNSVNNNNAAWTLSASPVAVQVRNNRENNYSPAKLLFTLGNYRAEDAGNGRVSNYQQASPNRATNHWYIETAGENAVVELNKMTDGVQSLVESAALVGTQLQYTATVGSAARGTVVVPFEADVTGDVEAFTLSFISDSKVKGEQVETIEANQPVLLKNAGTLVLTAKEGTVAYNAAPEEGLLKGVYETMDAPIGSYVLQKQSEGVAFYRVTDADHQPTIKPFRAYLDAPSNARVLSIDLDGDVTGIGSLSPNASAEGEGSYYSIDGRKLTGKPMQRGIYVVNGKKVVIK